MLAKRNAMSLFGGEPCEGFAGAAQGLGRDDLGVRWHMSLCRFPSSWQSERRPTEPQIELPE